MLIGADEHVRRIEQFDQVCTPLAAEATALDWDFDTEAL